MLLMTAEEGVMKPSGGREVMDEKLDPLLVIIEWLRDMEMPPMEMSASALSNTFPEKAAAKDAL